MQNMQMELKGGGCLEVAFAAVKPGFEDQLFKGYFPKVGPIILEYGARPLGSFKLLAPPASYPEASFGAFFYWPSTDAYDAFHEDTRFKALKSARDEALSLLSSGHFFGLAEDQSITIEPEIVHQIAIANGHHSDNSLFSLTSAHDSPNKTYAGKRLSLTTQLNAPVPRSGIDVETASVSFNPPAT